MIGIKLGLKGQQHILGDSNVSAFLAATGITGTTQVNAITNLVANLKNYGLWSKMTAIYPFVSDTYNLLSYTNDYANAYWTKNGITLTQNATTAPNGTNTGNKITETAVTSGHWLKTILSLTAGSTYTISGYFKAAERQYAVLIDDDAGLHTAYFNLLTGTLVSQSGYTSTSITSVGNGWFRCSATRNASSGLSNFYWAISSNGTTYNYLGDGTSGIYTWGFQFEQSSTLSTYQEITTTPAARFVSQFKYNLKDPRDLNAAFRLTFNGSWVYSQQGATPNGVNAYADSFFNPNSALTINSGHATVYSRTQTPKSLNQILRVTDGTNDFQISPNINFTGFNQYSAIGGTQVVNVANTDARGFYQSQRTSATSLKSFKNTTLSGTNTTSGTHTYPNFKIFLGAASVSNVPTNYSDIQTAFATLGDGLTDTQASNLYTSVQAFQVELSRQV